MRPSRLFFRHFFKNSARHKLAKYENSAQFFFKKNSKYFLKNSILRQVYQVTLFQKLKILRNSGPKFPKTQFSGNWTCARHRISVEKKACITLLIGEVTKTEHSKFLFWHV